MFAKFEQFFKIPQILSNYKNISIYDESRLKSNFYICIILSEDFTREDNFLFVELLKWHSIYCSIVKNETQSRKCNTVRN